MFFVWHCYQDALRNWFETSHTGTYAPSDGLVRGARKPTKTILQTFVQCPGIHDLWDYIERLLLRMGQIHLSV